MQDDKYTLPHEKENETSPDSLNLLKQENQRLLLEIAQLKKKLEKEEFLHQNLYKQWSELNALTLVKDRELKQLKVRNRFSQEFYRYALYALVLIVVVVVYYLLSLWGKNSASSQTLTSGADTVNHTTMQPQEQLSLPATNVKPGRNDTITVKPNQQASINETIATKTQENDLGKNFGRYKVKTKAFFYNKPDEGTRRNTFLLPYNDAYGLVTALDDKGGFIYITYVNHAGRTSKGWIRKADIEPVDH